MAVSATDNPAVVTISENGSPGANGADGADGAGFNEVRKTLIDNPLAWLYSKNRVVRVLSQLLTVSRTTSNSYTDIYGQPQVSGNDEPREEVKGWLINGDELHIFDFKDNVPDLDNGFSLLLRVGSYSETSPSQNIVLIEGLTGNLLTVGTDASGNWLVTAKGSDEITYQATTAVSATSASTQAVAVVFDGQDLVIHINGVASGSVEIPTGAFSSIDIESSVSITGDFTLNMQGLRFYAFAFNSNEIEYLD